jgi:hypothetical protein
MQLRNLPLDYFSGMLPVTAQAQGTLELDSEIRQEKGQPATSQLQLNSHALALVFTHGNNRPDTRIEASSAKLKLHGDKEKTTLDASILLDNDAKLLVNATISGTDQNALNRALNVRTSIGIAGIGFLGDFTPRISDAQGPFRSV